MAQVGGEVLDASSRDSLWVSRACKARCISLHGLEGRGCWLLSILLKGYLGFYGLHGSVTPKELGKDWSGIHKLILHNKRKEKIVRTEEKQIHKI